MRYILLFLLRGHLPADTPGGSTVESLPVTQETQDAWVPTLGQKDPHGKPLQYSCLENSMDRGAWRAIVHGVAKSQTGLKRFSMHAYSVLSGSRA